MSGGIGFRFIVKQARLVLDIESNLLMGLVNMYGFLKHPDVTERYCARRIGSA